MTSPGFFGYTLLSLPLDSAQGRERVERRHPMVPDGAVYDAGLLLIFSPR